VFWALAAALVLVALGVLAAGARTRHEA